jgi:hypothetical protein
MPEHDPDHPDRAEQAFRDALARRADDLDPRPLDPPVRRRRPLLPVLAAAAAVVLLAVAVTWAVDNRRGSEGTRSPDAADVSDDAAPADGTRTVGFLDVEVEVPASWGDEYAPTDQWCVTSDGNRPTRADFPTAPYVARDASSMPSTLVGCPESDAPAPFPPVPSRFWAPHVQLLPATYTDAEDGTATYEGWTLTTRRVGSVVVQVLTDGDAQVADAIIASARVRDTDDNGCSTQSSITAAEFVRPEPFDVTDVETVDEIAVCLYSRGSFSPAGLVGSRTIRGAAAQAELDAIKAAPAGGGPDTPETCSPDLYGDQGIVLRLRDQGEALGDLHVYFDWCFGNGFDDGTTRRALTTDSCPPLWGGAVQQYGGSGAPFRVCHPG